MPIPDVLRTDARLPVLMTEGRQSSHATAQSLTTLISLHSVKYLCSNVSNVSTVHTGKYSSNLLSKGTLYGLGHFSEVVRKQTQWVPMVTLAVHFQGPQEIKPNFTFGSKAE